MRQKDKISRREMREITKKMLILLGITFIVGALYSLKLPYILISLVCTAALVPKYTEQYMQGLRQRKRYDRVVLYMEQILYSFKKKPKIREALLDVAKTGDRTMKELMEEIILNIDSKMNENIFEDSLKIMEEE